jgi:hypothetical protein
MSPLILLGCNISWTYRRGGSVWTKLSWILGFERAGVDVFVVDQLALKQCAIAPGQERSYANALNVGWFEQIVAQFGLSGRGADRKTVRPLWPRLDELPGASADAL